MNDSAAEAGSAAEEGFSGADDASCDEDSSYEVFSGDEDPTKEDDISYDVDSHDGNDSSHECSSSAEEGSEDDDGAGDDKDSDDDADSVDDEDADDDADSEDREDADDDTDSEDREDADDDAGAVNGDGDSDDADSVGDGDSDDADSVDDEDSDDDEEEPQTPMQRLIALAEQSCSLLTMPREVIGSGLAQLTRGGSAAALPLPAATVGSLALGLPHAHPAHPPFVPLVPMGPVLVGFSNTVLISGLPAVLSGALGANPTCCGLSPFYEVLTGSSKVLIDGEHAVRTLDLTLHCQAAPVAPRRVGAVAQGLGRALQGAEQALEIAHKVEDIADFADQSAAAVVASGSAGTSGTGHAAAADAARLAVSMAMTGQLAEKAQDQLSEAMARLMGLDAAVPAGTPGTVVAGEDRVLIGGLSLPSGAAVVRGLLRLLRLPKTPKCGKGAKGPKRRARAPGTAKPLSPPKHPKAPKTAKNS